MQPSTPHRGPCDICGEDWPGIVSSVSGRCPNCTDTTPARRIAHCPICGRGVIPAQLHHVAGQRHSQVLAFYVCCSCHRILTDRQCAAWEASWKTQSGAMIRARCIIQGTVDVLWLTWERSGCSAWHQLWERQLREICHMLYLALLALAEVLGLRGFNVIGWESTR